MATSKWKAQSELAAQLVAEGKLTNAAIGERVGMTRQGLDKWKAKPEFQALVERYEAEFRATIRRRGIAQLERRVDALNDRWERLRRVIAERAEAPIMADEPGGPTGLLVHTLKGLGGGDNFQVVSEFAVDTGLLRELREHEKQAAQELGQWMEKREHTGPGGAPLFDFSGLSNVDLNALKSVARKLVAGGPGGGPASD